MALVNKPDESIFASSAKQGEVDNFPDLLRGWGVTFDQTQGIPPMEWFNFLFKRLDEKHTYLMQRGLPEWSATQDYTKGSCVQFDGVSYRALKNSKNNRPNESNSQYWVRWGFALSEIARATLQQPGIVQLSSSTNSESESEAATSKAVKIAHELAESKQSPATTLAGYGIGNFKVEPFVGNLNTLKTDGVYAITQASRSQNLPVSTSCHIQVIAGGDGAWCRQLAYVAYSTDVYERHQTSYQTDSWSPWVKIDSLDKIPNSKKSSEVNSESEDNVATSKAVKTAYDKGVDAKTAADNANNNANGRVSKSGDSMNGMLTITNSSTTYRVNDYNWPKKIELSGDSVIGNEACIIGFNNNGTLHLGGKPNSNEFNASIDETGLWVKGDVVTKSGASLNNAFMKTGGVVTGDTSFKQGDWSGISFYNNSGRYVRVESNPHGSNSMLSFVYRESNGSNINVASLPRKNGNILLDSDISHATNGTNKEKVASEFALNELNKKLSTVIRKNYTKTIKGTNASFDNATQKNINLEGETIIHPDGKIEQIIHFKAFRVWWFYFEAKNNSERLAIEIPVPLWTAMPNKITNVTATFSRTESGGSFSFGAEAFEWWPPSWAFERQNNIKDRLWLYTIRHVGNQDEHIDLWVKVEGY